MVNKAVIIAAGLIGVMLVMAGCQSATPVQPNIDQGVVVPHSKGPSSPPYVKGPTSPPPGVSATDVAAPGSGQPEAVTEQEKVKYELPATTVPEVR